MKLYIDGNEIELKQGSFSFKKTNNAFTFGKFTLSRTQTLNIPKTPANMQVFGFGRVDEYGVGERKKYDAQIIVGAIPYNGYFYLTEVTTDAFKGTFVYGDIYKLKTLSEIKKISDVLDDEKIYIDSRKKANANDLSFVDNVLYLNKNSTYKINITPSYGWSYAKLMPSINLQEMFARINAKTPIIFDQYAINGDMRMILGDFKASEFSNVIYSKISINVISASNTIEIGQTENVANTTGVRGNRDLTKMKELLINNVSLTFPLDFPDDLFLVADYTHYESWSGWVVVDLEFFGDYSFDWELRQRNSLAYEGERDTRGLPLAGRTIEVITKSRTYYNSTNTQSVTIGPRLSFFRKNDFHNIYIDENSDTGRYAGFFTGDASPFSITFPSLVQEITRGTFDVPYSALLLANLPEISPLNLYSALATLQNKYVVVFDNYVTMQDWTEGDYIDLQNVIQVSSIKREAITTAQNNLIDFKSDKILESERIIVNYNTQNENLENEKKIYTFPFSEGTNSEGNIFVNDIEEEPDAELPKWSKYAVSAQEPTIAIANANSEYLQRVNFVKNELLNKIYTESTMLSLSCYMNFFEFNKIKENTILIYQGQKFVWTDAQFNNNVVKFTLFKCTS